MCIQDELNESIYKYNNRLSSFHSKKRQIIIMWLYCSRFVKLHLSLKMCIQDELNESIYK
jgi:hypothetical protein